MQVALLALTCLVFLVGATLGNTAFLSESIQSQKGRKLDIQDDPFFRFGDPADVDPPPPAAATSASFHQPTHIAVIDSNDLLTGKIIDPLPSKTTVNLKNGQRKLGKTYVKYILCIFIDIGKVTFILLQRQRQLRV